MKILVYIYIYILLYLTNGINGKMEDWIILRLGSK